MYEYMNHIHFRWMLQTGLQIKMVLYIWKYFKQIARFVIHLRSVVYARSVYLFIQSTVDGEDNILLVVLYYAS